MRLKRLGFAVVLALLTALSAVFLAEFSRASVPDLAQAEVAPIAEQVDASVLCWALTEALSAVNQPQPNAAIVVGSSSLPQGCRPSTSNEPTSDPAVARYQDGNLFLRQQQYKQAISSYQQALDLGKQTITELNQDLERDAFESVLYKLGFAYFKLAEFADRLNYFPQREQALAGAKDVLEKAASGMNVFSQTVQQSVRSGNQTRTTQARGSSDYLLQARTFKLLQQVYIAQKQFDQALLAAEKGRTIEIDQNIVSNLWNHSRSSDQQRLLEVAAKLAQISNLSIETIQKIARDENATLVSYSLLSTTDDPRPPYTGDATDPSVELPTTPSEKLSIWVVQPTGEITFKQQDLSRPLTDHEFNQPDSLDFCRGQSGVAVSSLVRWTRSCMGIVDRDADSAPVTTVTPDEKLRQLYQILIPPDVKALLPTDPEAHVIFVPQGPLFFVPFPALKDASGQYLIEQHTILTAPNLRALLLPQNQQPSSTPNAAQGSVLVVGNPTTSPVLLGGGTSSQDNAPQDPASINRSPEKLPPLAKAAQEAQAIVDLFKPKYQIDAFINEPAPEDVVRARMSQAQIIHFATHGVLEAIAGSAGTEADCPIRARVTGLGTTQEEVQQALDRIVSRLRAECEAQIQLINTYSVQTASGAIVLSPAANDPTDRDNGLLTAREILKLKLNADLVVLSACNTGRGPLTAGGVIGLPFAFSVAGAQNIIVSLWAVPDDSTAELMTRFYQQLGIERSDKAHALRQAMRGFLQSHPDAPPRDWAGFTLMGRYKAALNPA